MGFDLEEALSNGAGFACAGHLCSLSGKAHSIALMCFDDRHLSSPPPR
jgi:hypothetical protein